SFKSTSTTLVVDARVVSAVAARPRDSRARVLKRSGLDVWFPDSATRAKRSSNPAAASRARTESYPPQTLSFVPMEVHGFSASHWVLLVQAFPGGRGFDDVPATQVKDPVRSATHFKPAQHGAWFAPQLAPSVAMHAQDVATKSPWDRCAGTAFSLTVTRCAFVWLPGGVWQMVVFAAAAI